MPSLRELSKEPLNIVYLGNIDKGAERIVSIAQSLRRTSPQTPIVFSIYGSSRAGGITIEQLKEQTAEAGVDDIVLVKGHSIDVETILSRAFALIRPSHNNDPWGRDVIEATAAGVPVLATGTFDGVISSKNGFLFEQFDASAFAEAIVLLYNHPDLWLSMSENGKSLGREKFSGKTQSQQFNQAVKDLIGEDTCRNMSLSHERAATVN